MIQLSNVRKLFPLIIILAFAIVLYYPALSFGYVWDDSLLFINNIELLQPELNWHMLSQPVLPGTTYFRPLVFLSWFAEFHYFGQNTTISHAINIAIYLLNISLLYVLGLKLFVLLSKKRVVLCASMAALLYAVHPSLIETTAWVSGRFDLLVTCFTLLACVVYMQPLRNRLLKLALLNVCFLMSLMSKELAVVLPLILVCLSLLRSNETHFFYNLTQFIRHEWALIVSFTVSFLAYMVLRVYSVQQVYHSTLSADYIQDVIIEQQVPLYALSNYIFKAFLPFYTSFPMHPMITFAEPSTLSKIKITISLLLLVYCLYKAFIKNSAAAWLGFSAFLSILPVLHIIPLTVNDNLVSDRFMTLGLAFVALAVVALPYDKAIAKINLLRPRITKSLLSLLIIFWLVLSSISVYNILPFWQSDLTLWHWMYKIYPNHRIARYSYYQALYSVGQYQKIVDEIKIIHSNENGLDVDIQIIYANALMALKDPESFDYIQGIVQIMPKFHKNTDNPREALLHSFVGLSPLQVAGLYNSFSLTYVFFKNDLENALKYNRVADSYLMPTERFKNKYQRVAIYYLLGDVDRAINLYHQLNKAIPNNKERYANDIDHIITSYCEKNINRTVCKSYIVEKPFN